MMFEASSSSNNPNLIGQLMSPVVELESNQEACLEFYYNAYGS
jgi:hypothetical protein